MARWVRRRDPAGRVQAIPSQQRGALERFGVARAEAERAAWTIDSQGQKLAGAAAVNRVLGQMGGAWPAVAKLYRVRPIAAAEEAFYRWFARHRGRFHAFGITPECDDRGAGCG